MIVDPVQAFATAKVPVATSSVAPIPTVVPTLPEYEVAGEAGHRSLWVGFVVMLISMIVFVGVSWSIPMSKRLFHVITTLIVTIATLSYFAMASGHGVSEHYITEKQHHKHGVPDTTKEIVRQVYWARYVDWALTTPLLLLDLCLVAGLDGGHTLLAIVADLIMALTGLFAAFGREDTPQRWGWYTIACISYLVIVWQLLGNGRVAALACGERPRNFFLSIAGFTLVVWAIYPIIWGIGEGARKMSVDEEIIAYVILDILAKPVFGAWLLFSHARLPEINLELNGYWSTGLASEGQIRVGDDDEGA
ncbi:bacteriorhodopsin [Piedraia hortae CBS 480.64]|uniref:Bacteriorhodopsin n=1 Tax=Piedraia hortae CBS 480.64 TaxID=1314780 RepID=A0A6A7C7V9_9PEZI|nr:bacteriorhodopsin [Piedraia hortae CBS 480.64]